MKRLRKLRDLDRIPVSTSWDAVRSTEPSDNEAPLHTPSRGRRAVVIAVAFGLFAASVGVFLFTWGDDAPSPAVDSPSPAVPAARSLTVFCAENGTTVSSDVVALGRSGVDVTVQNPDAVASLVLLRDPDNPDGSGGMELGRKPQQEATFMLRPGRYLVGCFSPDTPGVSTGDIPVAEYPAVVQVVDPDGNWARIQAGVTCGGPLPDATETAGTDAPLVGPPTGRVVLGARDPASDATSFVSVAADGADAQPLFPDLAVEEAVFSPDGSRVALVINDSDGDPTTTDAALEDSEIYVANADGSGLTRLTDNQRSDDLVHWTPDGTLLSFSSNRGHGIAIYTMRADGTNVQRVTPDTWIADSHDWSAADGSLVFSGEAERNATGGCSDNEIAVLGHDGVVTPLTDDEWYDQSPSWSPDGSRIAYSASDQSDYAWEIFTMNADGSHAQRITDYPGYDQQPVWSPDGSMLAFTSDRFRGPDATSEDQGGLPYVMNADGSGVRLLFTTDQLQAMGIDPASDVFVEDWRP